MNEIDLGELWKYSREYLEELVINYYNELKVKDSDCENKIKNMKLVLFGRLEDYNENVR